MSSLVMTHSPSRLRRPGGATALRADGDEDVRGGDLAPWRSVAPTMRSGADRRTTPRRTGRRRRCGQLVRDDRALARRRPRRRARAAASAVGRCWPAIRRQSRLAPSADEQSTASRKVLLGIVPVSRQMPPTVGAARRSRRACRAWRPGPRRADPPDRCRCTRGRSRTFQLLGLFRRRGVYSPNLRRASFRVLLVVQQFR